MWRLFDNRRLLSLFLGIALVWSLASVDWGSAGVHSGGGGTLREFVLAAFPPELSPAFLRVGLAAAWQTTTFAVAAITIAVVVGAPLGALASGQLVSSSSRGRALAVGARLFLAVIRSVHELVWAVLFVAAFGFLRWRPFSLLPSPTPGYWGGSTGKGWPTYRMNPSGPCGPPALHQWRCWPTGAYP